MAAAPQTLDTFIIKDSNRLAALAVAGLARGDEPLRGVRALFLAAAGPWGKTHLAAGFAAALEAAGVAVLRLPGGGEWPDPLPWREAGAVALDDAHLLAGRPAEQRLVARLIDEGPASRLLFTAQALPRELTGLGEQLRSRLGGGLTLAIERPEFNLLVELAGREASRRGLAASAETLSLLARASGGDPRHLLGLVGTAAFVAEATGTGLDEAAPLACPDRPAGRGPAAPLTLEAVMDAVAQGFGLKVADLTGNSKIRGASWPRRVAMYLARELTGLTTTQIGAAFGGRDHSTVIHALQKIRGELKTPARAELVENIRRGLLAGRG